MTVSNDKSGDPGLAVRAARLRLGSGWTGRVSLSDSSGYCFAAEDWQDCLSNPMSLNTDPEQTLKSDNGTTVVVKNLKISKH